jgi:hypothetical protein
MGAWNQPHADNSAVLQPKLCLLQVILVSYVQIASPEPFPAQQCCTIQCRKSQVPTDAHVATHTAGGHQAKLQLMST